MTTHPMVLREPQGPPYRDGVAPLIPDSARHQAAALTIGADGEQAVVHLPAEAVELLAQVLMLLAKGERVSVLHTSAELSTIEAARILGVSRPHLVGMLNRGLIPSRKVGSHRRIRVEDIERYQVEERRARRAALDELTAVSQEMGLYEDWPEELPLSDS